MSGRGCRGRSRRVIPAVSERPAVPVRDEYVVGSTTASMNQPPAAGQAGPSGPPEGAQVPELFTAEQVAQIAQIVAIATVSSRSLHRHLERLWKNRGGR